MANASRRIEQLIPAQPASDGAGVKLRRYFDARLAQRTDPFLMLDNFGTDQPQDYLAGFPSHPHRGFETVTYMLEGRMRHEDSRGNRGDLEPGSVQWMKAARGIIHSEMPQQTEGRMQGFQLWINLPASEKMSEPGYQDIPAAKIPQHDVPGGHVRVIAGEFEGTHGPAQAPSTQPLYLDIHLQPGSSLTVAVPPGHRALLVPWQGQLSVAEDPLRFGSERLALLTDGDQVKIHAQGDQPLAALLIAARPIGEPVAHYGPFVMNTQAELQQAVADYQAGRLA